MRLKKLPETVVYYPMMKILAMNHFDCDNDDDVDYMGKFSINVPFLLQKFILNMRSHDTYGYKHTFKFILICMCSCSTYGYELLE